MDLLANDYPEMILDERTGPCLSLYQPTHRALPERNQDPIRFRNLVKTLAESLKQKYPKREVEPLLAPFHALADNQEFWNHSFDGLAVLGTPDSMRVYKVQRSLPEFAVVADSFHTKPLMRIMQSADRYQILAIDRNEARLFEGNRDQVDEIPLASGVPRNVDAAVSIDAERERATRTHGRVEPGVMGRHGGSDVKSDAIDADTERFFRAVDRAVTDLHTRPTGLPLLLAALPEHHHLFRKVSNNPNLLAASIDVNPKDLTMEQLRDRAWSLVQPMYLERLAGLVEAFGAASAKQQGTSDLSDAARAAAQGRVATLLLQAGHRIPGKIDATTGALSSGELSDPETDDMLDDLGELVLRKGGEVVIVPAERMPSKSGLAATYRF
ncbi:MAG TPA: hypothetical protein VFN25_07955 [Dokdonella sp.]|uniref:baeRF3 domain-containing protein n=1 Tax=Dokdonella sp. TaxID=2291710 RepID=UPI002D7FB1A6|nr:hypothetical protein [Dokdonella sp.]HET9032823.1 hypothetical protein [Dokdonella sp.]